MKGVNSINAGGGVSLDKSVRVIIYTDSIGGMHTSNMSLSDPIKTALVN